MLPAGERDFTQANHVCIHHRLTHESEGRRSATFLGDDEVRLHIKRGNQLAGRRKLGDLQGVLAGDTKSLQIIRFDDGVLTLFVFVTFDYVYFSTTRSSSSWSAAPCPLEANAHPSFPLSAAAVRLVPIGGNVR